MRGSVDRAQAVQVGAILLFGILIVSLSLYQATVVPGQNEQIEFDGYLDANSDMDRLDSEIGAAAARDYTTRTVVRTGVSYPSRTLFVNPPRPDNRVRTGESGDVVISNATAIDGEEDNTGLYWDGSSRTYSTKPVLFDSDYNELQAPSIVNENGVMYRVANENADPPYGPDDVIVMSNGDLINDDRITLVTVAGDVDAGGNSPTIVASPKSAHTRSVVVEGDGSDVTLTIPSQLSNETWEEEIVSDDVTVLQNGSNVDLVLDGDETYELRLAKVELRQQSDASDQRLRPNAHYIVPASGDGQSISTNQSARLTAEVRDEYNNPKRGETVNFTSNDGTFVTDNSVRTDSDGQATVRFEPDPDSTGQATVTATVDGVDGPNETTFSINVGVGDGGGGDGTGSGGDTTNPPRDDSQGSLVWQSAIIEEGTGQDPDVVNVVFENTGDSELSIISVRYQFYHVDNQPARQGVVAPGWLTISEENGGTTNAIEYVGSYVNVQSDLSSIDANDAQEYTFRFDESTPGDGDFDAGNGDFFMISIKYELDDENTATYFIGVTE